VKNIRGRKYEIYAVEHMKEWLTFVEEDNGVCEDDGYDGRNIYKVGEDDEEENNADGNDADEIEKMMK